MDDETRRAISGLLASRLPDHVKKRLIDILIDAAAPKADCLAARFFEEINALPAGAWQDIDASDLPKWVGRCMRGKSPPIYTLAAESPPLDLAPSGEAEVRRLPLETERRSDSGLWRVRIPVDQSPGFEAARASVLDRVHDSARRLDERTLETEASPHSEVIASVSRSRLPEHDLPVLGPGGRVTVYSIAGAVEVDVVLRKRLQRIPSQWRSEAEVAGRIRHRIAALQGERRIGSLSGSLGYFELSRYERQTHLRPVFVLHVELLSPGEAPGRWRGTVVEPATTAPDIGLAEGLGSWAA